MEQASSGRNNAAAAERNIDVDDLISKLPDAILSHILSFLNMKEAFRTRLLSCRWKNLFIPVVNLELDSKFILGFDLTQNSLDNELKCKFVEGVDKFLNLVTVKNLCTLKICFPLDKEFASHIDEWMSFAVEMKCKEMELDFEPCTQRAGYSELYNFPCHLLPLCEESPLKHLLLKECILKPLPELANRFNCLESLRLDHVPMGPSDLEIILSGCLNLEWLGLVDCSLLSTLRICGQHLRLKWLLVSFCDDLQKIELSVPNLEMFEYEGWLPSFAFSSLNQLKKVFLLIYGRVQRGWNQMLDELAKDVPHLQTLSLSWIADQSLSYAYIKDTPMFYNLTHLELSFGIGDYYWNMLINFLYRSHQLEVLVIDKGMTSLFPGGGPSWTDPQPVPGCVSSHLRKVRFRQYHGLEIELEFWRYILRNAKVLETMKITFSAAEAKDQIIEKLSACPRSSETCQFLFD